MASISITLRTADGDYSIDIDQPETMREAHGGDQNHLDKLLAKAVTRIQRAYGSTAPTLNP